RASLFRELVNAVSAAHGELVVHGDLKPDNVLVDRQHRPYVLDFGLARFQRGGGAARPSAVGGTPGFLPPEVLQGQTEPSYATDIYALGVMLYMVLTGTRPFSRMSEAVAGEPTLPMERDPDIPEPLQRICLKAMEAKPEDRYQTAEQMAADLGRFCRGEAIFVRPTAYARELQGRVQNHIAQIQIWEREGVISKREMDAMLRPYDRVQHEDAPWLSETRKMLLGPLLIRAGAWLLLLSTIVWLAYWEDLTRWQRVLTSGIPTLLMGALGTVFLAWKNRRNAILCLGSFALLLPVFMVVLFSEFRWLVFLQPPNWELCERYVEYAKKSDDPLLSNSQVFLIIVATVTCVWILLRRLKALVFSSWLAIGCVAVLSALLWLCGGKLLADPVNDRLACMCLYYLLGSWVLFLMGDALERRGAKHSERPFYVASLSLLIPWIAAHLWWLPHDADRALLKVRIPLLLVAWAASICLWLRMRRPRMTVFFLSSAACFAGLVIAALALLGFGKLPVVEITAWGTFYYLIGLGFLVAVASRAGKGPAIKHAERPFYVAGLTLLVLSAFYLAVCGTHEWVHHLNDLDDEVLNFWLMSYSVPLFLLASHFERRGTESQRLFGTILYLLVPVAVLWPLNVLFEDKGFVLMTIGREPVRFYEALYLPACIAIFYLGKRMQLRMFIWTSLAGTAVFVFRVTFRHFLDYRAWPLTLGIFGCALVALGMRLTKQMAGPPATQPEAADSPSVPESEKPTLVTKTGALLKKAWIEQ
ncbi:MAG: protein kinase domain-containing protein, partial [Alphaproteobacteria bacterium]